MTFDKVFIIAEAGVNHNGNKELAFDLIQSAAKAGADAIKFQTFKAKQLASKTVAKARYQTNGIQESQLEMLAQLELAWEDYPLLQAYAKEHKILFLSSAFDASSLAFLQTLDLPYYKIASGELTNAPLLWQFSQVKKPLILSTGMATLAEVEQALAVLTHGLNHSRLPRNCAEIWRCWSDTKARAILKKYLILLHCTSEYPTPISEVNLKAMTTLARAFELDIGYSDHTQGITIATAAVALGAKIIEKHFTLDNHLPGPDHKASLEPSAFAEMVGAIRTVERALGSAIKTPQPSEWATRKVVRQTLVAKKTIIKGQIITVEDLTTLRAGEGIIPFYYWDLLGKSAKKSYSPGELIEE